MKNLRLIVNVLIVCYGLLEMVSSIPTKYIGQDNKEYIIETEQKYNFFESSTQCAKRGFQLAVIDSATKTTIVTNVVKRSSPNRFNLWIGAMDGYQSGGVTRKFFWIPTGYDTVYTNWQAGQPDNLRGEEHCAIILATSLSYQWSDVNCTLKYGFICEANPLNQSLTTELKNKCATLPNMFSTVSIEFSKAQVEISSVFENTTKDLTTSLDAVVAQLPPLVDFQSYVDQFNSGVDQDTTDLLLQVDNLLSNYMTDLNEDFKSTLNSSVTQLMATC